MSTASFYRCVHHGIDAINACPGLSIKFPLILSELVNSAKDFCSISSHGIMNGCVAALDGWICRIWVPPANEVTRVKSYFSGHYQCYELNVQATCDASCHFTSISVLCPGSTSAIKAFILPMSITWFKTYLMATLLLVTMPIF
jgi:hypothetical protein